MEELLKKIVELSEKYHEEKYKNLMLEQKIKEFESNSINKQIVKKWFSISDDYIFIQDNAKDEIRKTLGEENE